MAETPRKAALLRPKIELTEPMVSFQIGSCTMRYDINTAKQLYVELGQALENYKLWENSQKENQNVTRK